MRPDKGKDSSPADGNAGSQTAAGPQESKCTAVGINGSHNLSPTNAPSDILPQLTDVCVKNGGSHFLAEIAGREFMDNLVSILKMPVCISNFYTVIWFLSPARVSISTSRTACSASSKIGQSHLRANPNSYISTRSTKLSRKKVWNFLPSTPVPAADTLAFLSNAGFVFPPKDLALATDAMTDTAIAPEWIDSDVCLRCRDSFTTFNRKHHCRNCGLIFDHKCSSKTLPLPHFGITQAVRVCDACHFKLTKKKEVEQAAKESSEAKKRAAVRTAAIDAIDPDLQKAIQLSLQESQARPGYTPTSSTNRWQVSEPPIIDRMTRPDDDEDKQLREAIEASLREAQAPQPSAPIVDEVPTPTPSVPTLAPYELNPQESDAILTFNQTVMAGTVQDPRRVHELSNRAEAHRPKLTRSLDDAGRKEREFSLILKVQKEM
jgi:growth factor-regulated tyrosine kinase substrate